VSIARIKIIDYLIDDILEEKIRSLEKIRCFSEMNSLLKAVTKIKLNEKNRMLICHEKK
jgi:hypothetical protein